MPLSLRSLLLIGLLSVSATAQNSPDKPAAETPANSTDAIPTAAQEDLPSALMKEGRYEVDSGKSIGPNIESQALEKEYPENIPEKKVEDDDFLYGAQKRVERLFVSNVGIQQKYRPAHRFGLWASYSSSVLAKSMYRSTEDSGLIDAMQDSGFGLGVQLDFSWVEKPESPQPSNSSLRVRAGFIRSKLQATEAYLAAHDPSKLESAMNVFHMAFLLKNALPLDDSFRTWAGGGVFLNYVLTTERPQLQSDASSNILNSLAFGPILSVGADFAVGEESELLLEVDYQLFKSWGVQLGMKTSL